jgi:hypothetical protein
VVDDVAISASVAGEQITVSAPASRAPSKRLEIGMDQDLEIRCVSCDQVFVFTTEQQQFHHDFNLAPPRHCRRCKRAEIQQRIDGPDVKTIHSEDWRSR